MIIQQLNIDIVILKDLDGRFKAGDRAVLREIYPVRPEPWDTDLDHRVEHKETGAIKWIAKVHFELAPVEEEIHDEPEDSMPPEPPGAVMAAEVETIHQQLSLFGEEAVSA